MRPGDQTHNHNIWNKTSSCFVIFVLFAVESWGLLWDLWECYLHCIISTANQIRGNTKVNPGQVLSATDRQLVCWTLWLWWPKSSQTHTHTHTVRTLYWLDWFPHPYMVNILWLKSNVTTTNSEGGGHNHSQWNYNSSSHHTLILQ